MVMTVMNICGFCMAMTMYLDEDHLWSQCGHDDDHHLWD